MSHAFQSGIEVENSAVLSVAHVQDVLVLTLYIFASSVQHLRLRRVAILQRFLLSLLLQRWEDKKVSDLSPQKCGSRACSLQLDLAVGFNNVKLNQLSRVLEQRPQVGPLKDLIHALCYIPCFISCVGARSSKFSGGANCPHMCPYDRQKRVEILYLDGISPLMSCHLSPGDQYLTFSTSSCI